MAREPYTILSRPGLGEDFPRYRMRPVEVRAQRMDRPFRVSVLAGLLWGEAGDYLVVGPEGEVFPCKPEAFEKAYEAVEATSGAALAGSVSR